MEARIYFRTSSVRNRLEKSGYGLCDENLRESYLDKHFEFHHDLNSNLVYTKITEFHDLKVPVLCKGLKVVKVTVFDTLNKEENHHIKQGQGSEGKSRWNISFGDEKFEIPTANEYNTTYAYKSIIRIRIHGTDIQSAKACYDKIRQGKLGGNWKGEGFPPSHCGLPSGVGLVA